MKPLTLKLKVNSKEQVSLDFKGRERDLAKSLAVMMFKQPSLYKAITAAVELTEAILEDHDQDKQPTPNNQ